MRFSIIKPSLLMLITTAFFIASNGQDNTTVSTKDLAGDLKKLIALNSSRESGADLSGEEAVNLETNATAPQIIAITAPWLTSEVLTIKNICFRLLSTALFKKAKSKQQKQIITEL